MGKVYTNTICKFIYLKDNFMWLCQDQITFQNFIEEYEANIELLRQFLEKYAVIFQFIYANLFPKVYVRNNHFGIHNKTIFEFTYREWYCEKTNKAKKEQNNNITEAVMTVGKNPDAFEQRSATDVNEFEQ